MYKIGVLYCGFNQLENIKNTLTFWNELNIPGFEFIVGVISVPFSEYKNTNLKLDGSEKYIKSLPKKNIKYKIFDPLYIKETQARSICLFKLMSNNPSLIWQVDSDEYYTLDNVKQILNFTSVNHTTYAFLVNFKNYIFDGKDYVDFSASKINKIDQLKPLGFIDDNRILYEGGKVANPIEIPKDVAWVQHLTWLNETGKQKVEYQQKHFGHCSYKWNEEKQSLEFDLEYYKKFGGSPPIVNREK